MPSDLELLKQKRALELQRKIMLQQARAAGKSPVETSRSKTSPRDVVRGILEGRGVEVLETARRYYPKQIAVLERRIAEAVESGRLKGPVSGEELYSFLRSLGLTFNMDVKIRIAEKGKLKTLEEKFREESF